MEINAWPAKVTLPLVGHPNVPFDTDADATFEALAQTQLPLVQAQFGQENAILPNALLPGSSHPLPIRFRSTGGYCMSGTHVSMTLETERKEPFYF